MPSIITHHIFADEVLKKSKLADNINKTLYQTFAQSHDYLFYSNKKDIKELGHHAHKNKSQEYLINIIKNIKLLNLENDENALAYLYGSITHYVLDTNCHPYIFYKTGAYHKDDPSTKKYKGEHTRIEKDIDTIYYQNYYKKNIKYCNIKKEIINNPILTTKLKELISKTYKDTFNKDNIGIEFEKSINNAKRIIPLISNDRFGIKRIIYKLIDIMSNKKFGNLTAYSLHNLKPNVAFLNDERKTWNNPCHKELKHNTSFNDIYEESVTKCIKIFKEIDNYFNERSDIEELKKILPNLSYINGLPLEEYTTMKYYEY